jgi:hypothetical protein
MYVSWFTPQFSPRMLRPKVDAAIIPLGVDAQQGKR